MLTPARRISTLPPVKKDFVVDVVQRLPQGTISRGWGWLARRRRPRLFVELFKRGFVRATGIDMAEAAEPIGAYESLEDLFVRPLRAGARRVDPEPSAVVSPVDGSVGACGTVQEGTLLQVKGRDYSLARLLGSEEDASRYEGGPYATLYLAPFNYHRIHSPVSGDVRRATLIPGALMPVFTESVAKVDELFARNERLITYIDSPDAGSVAVCKVGATLVGRIGVTYDTELQTNVRGQARRDLTYDPPRLMNKGAELGVFELGSTVVLIGEKGRVSFDALQPGQAVQMGQRIGSVSARKRGRGRASARSGSAGGVKPNEIKRKRSAEKKR